MCLISGYRDEVTRALHRVVGILSRFLDHQRLQRPCVASRPKPCWHSGQTHDHPPASRAVRFRDRDHRPLSLRMVWAPRLRRRPLRIDGRTLTIKSTDPASSVRSAEWLLVLLCQRKLRVLRTGKNPRADRPRSHLRGPRLFTRGQCAPAHVSATDTSLRLRLCCLASRWSRSQP